MASNNNDLLLKFMSRSNRRKKSGKPGIRTGFPRPGQGENARFTTSGANNPPAGGVRQTLSRESGIPGSGRRPLGRKMKARKTKPGISSSQNRYPRGY